MMLSSATKEMAGIKVVTTRHTGRLVLEGEFTIQNASDIRDYILGLLTDKKKVTVDVTNITGADSSIFQLLCAARRRAVEAGLDLVIKCKEGCAFLRDASEAGFHRSGNCKATDKGTLFWNSISCKGQGE